MQLAQRRLGLGAAQPRNQRLHLRHLLLVSHKREPALRHLRRRGLLAGALAVLLRRRRARRQRHVHKTQKVVAAQQVSVVDGEPHGRRAVHGGHQQLLVEHRVQRRHAHACLDQPFRGRAVRKQQLRLHERVGRPLQGVAANLVGGDEAASLHHVAVHAAVQPRPPRSQHLHAAVQRHGRALLNLGEGRQEALLHLLHSPVRGAENGAPPLVYHGDAAARAGARPLPLQARVAERACSRCAARACVRAGVRACAARVRWGARRVQPPAPFARSAPRRRPATPPAASARRRCRRGRRARHAQREMRASGAAWSIWKRPSSGIGTLGLGPSSGVSEHTLTHLSVICLATTWTASSCVGCSLMTC